MISTELPQHSFAVMFLVGDVATARCRHEDVWILASDKTIDEDLDRNDVINLSIVPRRLLAQRRCGRSSPLHETVPSDYRIEHRSKEHRVRDAFAVLDDNPDLETGVALALLIGGSLRAVSPCAPARLGHRGNATHGSPRIASRPDPRLRLQAASMPFDDLGRRRVGHRFTWSKVRRSR